MAIGSENSSLFRTGTAAKAANHMIGLATQQQLTPDRPSSGNGRTSSIARLIGLLGGIVLAAGVAAPLIHIPIAGTISYMRQPAYLPGNYIGTEVLLGAAVASIVLTIVRRFKPLWLTGAVALGQLAATLLAFQHTAATVVAHAEEPDLVDPMLMWAGAALQRAHFEWGVGVIALGALLILAAAAWDLAHREPREGGIKGTP
jgi:hypothetical protein